LNFYIQTSGLLDFRNRFFLGITSTRVLSAVSPISFSDIPATSSAFLGYAMTLVFARHT
jgi:hypothetical protein